MGNIEFVVIVKDTAMTKMMQAIDGFEPWKVAGSVIFTGYIMTKKISDDVKNTNNPPNFAYIGWCGDFEPEYVEIDGWEDRDKLVALKGNRVEIYKFLEELHGDKLPDISNIKTVTVEEYDNPEEALCAGNPTIAIW